MAYYGNKLKAIQFEAELKKKIMTLGEFLYGPFHLVGSKFTVIIFYDSYKNKNIARLVVYPVPGDLTNWEVVLASDDHYDSVDDAVTLENLYADLQDLTDTATRFEKGMTAKAWRQKSGDLKEA